MRCVAALPGLPNRRYPRVLSVIDLFDLPWVAHGRAVRFAPEMRSLHDRDVVRLCARAHEGSMMLRSRGSCSGNRGVFHEAHGDPEIFERRNFITAVTSGYVQVDYHGWHQVRDCAEMLFVLFSLCSCGRPC